MVDGVQPIRQPIGRPRKRPSKLHGDKGYDYRQCRELLRQRNITPRIARKDIESSKRLGRHRYVIERCIEWTTRFRRLVRRYDRKAFQYLGFLRLACALICYRQCHPTRPADQQLPLTTHGLACRVDLVRGARRPYRRTPGRRLHLAERGRHRVI